MPVLGLELLPRLGLGLGLMEMVMLTARVPLVPLGLVVSQAREWRDLLAAGWRPEAHRPRQW